MDQVVSFNEANSGKTLILLQAYSMIIHNTVMNFLYNKAFHPAWLHMIIIGGLR